MMAETNHGQVDLNVKFAGEGTQTFKQNEWAWFYWLEQAFESSESGYERRAGSASTTWRP